MTLRNFLFNLLGMSLLIVSLGASALPVPPPPSMHVMSSKVACDNYAQQMANYLAQFDSGNDTFNLAWFIYLTNEDSNGGGKFYQRCSNGVCVNYYDVNSQGYGIDTACDIAGTEAQNAKQQYFKYLVAAYFDAVRHQEIPTSDPCALLGLYGPANTCNRENRRYSCKLYYKAF